MCVQKFPMYVFQTFQTKIAVSREWIPYDLTEKNLMDRISICNSLYKCNEETPFLKQVVTGDEKWIIYNNIERKRSWGKRNEPSLATPKANLHPKKIMLCVWWD